MVADRARSIAGALEKVLAQASAPALDDAALLGAFVERRDGAAFTELVRRHGPMVLGVCLRVLRHRQDAEDAFQATFLVLARKAGSVSPRNLVGNWLHGVALQTAVRARAEAMKRRGREAATASPPERASVPEAGWDDVAVVLDEELQRLPDHYRAVVLLCDVEGRSRRDAAAQLDCPEGSVSSRLSRARAMLARRLAGRGVTLSAGSLALLLGQNAANAAVPAALLHATAEAVGAVAAGTTLVAAASPAVASLTQGVLKAMLMTKLKALALVGLMLALIGSGGALMLAGGPRSPAGGSKAADASHPPARSGAKAADAGKLIGGWTWTKVEGDPGPYNTRFVFSADGQFRMGPAREDVVEGPVPFKFKGVYSLRNAKLSFDRVELVEPKVNGKPAAISPVYTVTKLTDTSLHLLADGKTTELTKDRFQFHPEPVPATDLKIGITAGKTVAVVVGPDKKMLGLKLDVTIKNDAKAAIKTLLPREWHGGQWPPTALYAAVAPAGAKEVAAYHPVYRFGESSAEARNVTIEAGGTHKIEIRTDWPGTDTPAIPLIDKPGKYSARFALVFEVGGKQQVIESESFPVEYPEPPGKKDKEDVKRPLTAKELTGKWFGEAENTDGIRKLVAHIDFDRVFGGDVHWRLRYETEESGGAEIGITGKRVENAATGRVDLHFQKTVLGHLARGEGDTILLTILPEFEKKNMPGERVYRRFEGLVLKRMEEPNERVGDLKGLQGTWTVLEERRPDPLEKGRAEQIKGGDLQWRFSGSKFAPALKGTQQEGWTDIHLDSSRSPKEMHTLEELSLFDRTRAVRSKVIYELKGDDLRVFGWVPRQGAAPAAPRDFDPKNYPGEKWTLTTLKRTTRGDKKDSGQPKQGGNEGNPALGVEGKIVGQTKGWSEAVNRLRARLVLVEGGKHNGTQQVVPYLELRTEDGGVKVRCDRRHVTFALVGPDGKERTGTTLPGNGTPTDDAGTVTVPSKGAAKVRMASSGWGIPKDAAAMLTAGNGAWVLEPKDKGKVFLRLTLHGENIENDPDRVPTWHGKIELSVPVTWGEPAEKDAARKLLDTMEGYRKVIPPPKDGMEEHNGPSVPETEPYLLTHLDGVARRLNVTTKAECVVLLPYLKDEDAKLRYIAMRALAGKVNAFPAGASAEAFTDWKSDEHRKMVLRYAELVARLAE